MKQLQPQTIGLDDWASDQDVEYILIAKVNDQVAFKTTSYDPDTIVDEMRHAEEEVAKLLNDQYQDASYPEYWSNYDGEFDV